MQISVFSSLKNSTPVSSHSVLDILAQIKEPPNKLKEKIEKIRAGEKELKASLPAVTFSGTFSKRNKNSLTEHSRLICLDFDKVDNLEKLKEKLKKIPFVFAYFVSPSGTGLKALVYTNPIQKPLEHEKTFNGLVKYISEPSLDTSTKDVSRLCFLSWDPDLYINNNCVPFYADLTPASPIYRVPVSKIQASTEDETTSNLLTWWQNKYQPSEGNRNNSLFSLACQLTRFGVLPEQTIRDNNLGLSDKEINGILLSAEKTAGSEFATREFEPRFKKIEISDPVTKEKKEFTIDVKSLTYDSVGMLISDYLGHTVRYNLVTDSLELDGERMTDRLELGLWGVVDSCLKGMGMKKDLPVRLFQSALVDASEEYHPIKEVFEQNKWDGIPRLQQFLAHFQDKHGQSNSYISHFLYGSIERLYKGFQNPMLVLDGPQNIGKSYFAKWLGSAFDGYFRENGHIDPIDKDSLRELSAKFIFEWAELRRFNNNELASLKGVLTAETIELRNPYARHSTVKPLLANIIANKNESAGFLKDITGNRRFNTLFIEKIDQSYSKKFDPLQIWLEVYELWQTGSEDWKNIDSIKKAEIDEEAFEKPASWDLLDDIIEEDPTSAISVADIHTEINRKDPRWDRNRRDYQSQIGDYFKFRFNITAKSVRFANGKVKKAYEGFTFKGLPDPYC